MTRFWLGRSVAWRLPSHATTTEAGMGIPYRSEQTSVVEGRVLAGNQAEFSKKKKTQLVFTPQVRISRKTISSFRSNDAQNPKTGGKAIAASQ